MKLLHCRRLLVIVFIFAMTPLKAQIAGIVGLTFWVDLPYSKKRLECTVIADYTVAITDYENYGRPGESYYDKCVIPDVVSYGSWNFGVQRIENVGGEYKYLTLPESTIEITHNAINKHTYMLTILAKRPPKIISIDQSIGISYDVPIYVPDESIDSYKKAGGWKNYNIRGISYNDVVSISLDKENISIVRDSTVLLTATALPEDADDRSVVWSSGNEDIATVDDNGLVTAVGVGTTVITATAHDGSRRKAECSVTVTPKLVKQIKLNADEMTLYSNDNVQLTATVYPEDADNKDVVWTSSNDWAVKVDKNGLVTCVDYSYGEAVVTATAKDGSGVTATCKVTLKQRQITSLSLSADELSLERTSTALLTSHTIPENVDRPALIWVSSDENVATVNYPGVFSTEGFVTAVGVGEAVITAYTTDGSGITATCKVIVTPKLVTSVTLDQSELTIEKTYTAQLSATVAPDDADNRTVTWTSDNEEIATVDENGLVTAVGEGTATITATANDGSDVSASCVVTVTFIDGIADVETSKVTVLAVNGRITVSGKEQDETVSVYDTGGRLLYRGEGDVIDVPRKAIYIVTVSGKSYKVIVP